LAKETNAWTLNNCAEQTKNHPTRVILMQGGFVVMPSANSQRVAAGPAVQAVGF